MLKPSLGGDIEIHTELDQEVPVIYADETRISQVIVNLALNSRDAMPDGGILTIGLSSGVDIPENTEKGDADYICLYVKDSGHGIPKENISKIFDPFFTTKGVGNGTGLGLSIVYGIVKSHNGFIRVESEVGKGTSFYIYFEISDKPFQVNEQIEIDYQPTGNENILVVDDEEMIRESIKDILSALGYNIITAPSGKEAIAILRKHRRIHLAIVDYVMPKMNGIETIKRLKGINPNIKILLSSGHTDREQLKMKDSRIDGFLLKPYHISDLAKKIKNILGKEIEERIV
jgi:CheY-like chemotaxis protein